MLDVFGGAKGCAVKAQNRESTVAEINAIFRPYLREEAAGER